MKKINTIILFHCLISSLWIGWIGCAKEKTQHEVAVYHTEINESLNGIFFLAFDVLLHLDSAQNSKLYPGNEGIIIHAIDSLFDDGNGIVYQISTHIFDSIQNRYIYPKDHIFRQGDFILKANAPITDPKCKITIQSIDPGFVEIGQKVATMKPYAFSMHIEKKKNTEWSLETEYCRVKHVGYSVQKSLVIPKGIVTNSEKENISITSIIRQNEEKLLETEEVFKLLISTTCGYSYVSGLEKVYSDHAIWKVIFNPMHELASSCPKRKKAQNGKVEIYLE
jgi:hypothetical protein